jgi:hypothetical protein
VDAMQRIVRDGGGRGRLGAGPLNPIPA